MINTLLKLWPLISGGSAIVGVSARWLWMRRSASVATRLSRQDKADALAREALEAAQAQIAAAVADHTDWLERELTRLQKEVERAQSAADVARASEVEAWRRARTNGREDH